MLYLNCKIFGIVLWCPEKGRKNEKDFLILLFGILSFGISNSKLYAELSGEWPVILVRLYQQTIPGGKEYLKGALIDLNQGLTGKVTECRAEAGKYLYVVEIYLAKGLLMYSAYQVKNGTPEPVYFYSPRIFVGALSLPINPKQSFFEFGSIVEYEPFVWRLEMTALTNERALKLWKGYFSDAESFSCQIKNP